MAAFKSRHVARSETCPGCHHRGGHRAALAGIGELSLNHFDEGVLVSGAFDVWLNGPWSFSLAQPPQAPPLFPWLIDALMWLTGTTWPIMGIYTSALKRTATSRCAPKAGI